MTDTVETDGGDLNMTLARAIWRSTREAPEDEAPEARKAAWKAEKSAAKKAATRVLRRLERAGVTVSKT